MRYLDEAHIESPNHCPYSCSRPDCAVLTPAHEMWRLTLRYRELEKQWQVSEAVALCCSRACAEAVARAFGADARAMKCLDHDEERACISRQIDEAFAAYRAEQHQQHEATQTLADGQEVGDGPK